jgi:hypothetical protein
MIVAGVDRSLLCVFSAVGACPGQLPLALPTVDSARNAPAGVFRIPPIGPFCKSKHSGRRQADSQSLACSVQAEAPQN